MTRIDAFARLCIAVAVLWPASGRADGGRLVLNRVAGDFRISVFTEPTPLRAGPIEIGVLVQDANDDTAVLDAQVTVDLEPEEGEGSLFRSTASTGETQNELLYATRLEPAAPGSYRLSVEVRRGAEREIVEVPIELSPAASPLSQAWPYLVIPPIAIAVFVLHQRLKRRHSTRA